MKNLLFISLLFLSSMAHAISNNSGFANSEVTASVDRINGTITVNYKYYHTNSGGGCQWGMRGGTPQTIIGIRESGQNFVNLGYYQEAGLNQGVWHGNAGVNLTYSHAPLNGSGGATRVMTVVFHNLDPKYFDGVIDIRLTGVWQVFGGGCGVSVGVNETKIINNGNMPSVSNLGVTDFCDKVRLSWTNPNNWTSRRTDILRNGQIIHTLVNSGATYYDDVSATPGVTYNYEARTAYGWNSNGTGTRFYVNPHLGPLSGTKYPAPDQPKNIFVDQVNCNGALEVNWSWSASTNPSRFIIQRAPNNSFNGGQVTEFRTSGSDRLYRDLTSQVGQNYFWRVVAQDDCPNPAGSVINGSWSSTEEQAGLGIPAAPSAVNLTVDTIGKKITVNWTDNSSMEDGFKVVRQSSLGQVEFDVAANATSYVDNSAQTCETYTYSIKSYNTCKSSGVLSSGPTGSASAYIPSDLGTVFNGTSQKIEATDGEFGDRIELRWSTPNRQVEFWNIYRINPLTNDTVLIGSPSGRTKFLADNTADANTFYKYLIQGETDCAGNIEFSNTSEDYGFRLAFGTINGQVTYTGGVAVEGVKVTAEPASGSSGKTGAFNGTSSFATVQNDDLFQSDTMTIQTYFYANNLNGAQTLVSKSSATTGIRLGLNFSQLVVWVGGRSFFAPDTTIKPQKWISATAVVASDSIKVFINGKQSASFPHNQSALDTTSNLILGSNGSNYFNGNLDEVRIYNRVLSNEEVQRSYDVYINPSSRGLVGYWRFDEGFGTVAYDYSKTLFTPNRNHAQMSNVTFVNNKPSTTQLTAGAYTNRNGSYFIPFIPFLGSGDNFILTPTFGTHSFSPATTTLLIGTGAQNYTGQDFEDQSSFSVSGTVKYKNTNCFVKDARLLIDGQVVIRNGSVAQTDANGVFDIQVPIGPHVVTVEKTSHDFSAGRFPASGAWDFQQNVQGIDFIDSTLVKVVGRVAGGSIQKALPPALARGKNNIGVAKIPFEAQQGNGCLVDTAVTNATTGEFEINLPPLRYAVPKFEVDSNPGISFDNNDLLDISNVPPTLTSTDSVFKRVNGRNVLDKIDSASYQRQLDFIHFVNPSIDVIGKDTASQLGSNAITYTKAGQTTEIPTSALSLNYPVFEENDEYTWLISAFEVYENKDGLVTVLDSVPMKEGNIEIVNNLSSDITRTFEYKITDTVDFSGIQEYTFQGGQANTSENSTIPAYSYTKTCEITLRPDNGNAESWKPNNTDPNNQDFRGVVLGSKALGNSFATQGPEIVTMILRDPPGTNSSASWSKEVTHSTTNSFNVEVVGGIEKEIEAKAGTQFAIGLGYTTETKIAVDVKNKNEFQTSVNSGGAFVEVRTNSVDISTGGGDEFVGADADLFFGRSYNMDFGLTQQITIIDTADCGDESNNCFGSLFTHNGKTYQLGSSIGMFVIPGGYQTEFVFTQVGIENSVIPKLVNLRNQLLISDPNVYVSNLPFGHPNYGKSNDDPIFTNATPDDLANTPEDSLGSSYHYKGYREVTKSVVSALGATKQIRAIEGVDSVWWYNQQIRLWEDALRRNEREKVLAQNKLRNVSYQAGSSITYSNSTSRDSSSTTSFSVNVGTTLGTLFGAQVANSGALSGTSIKMGIKTEGTFVRGTQSTTSFSYTFDDSDGDDEFTVDVYESMDGYSPIFKTRGGQTSCPYQGERKTKYFQPGVHTLDQATIQLEDPGISASPAQVFNVPANTAANISLNLINNGPEDTQYALKVLETTNPNGAILKIDGLGPNRNFAVPAGTSINKTLTVQRGPNHIKYDSIGLVFHSLCQFDFGAANYDDIADTVYISVEFLSSCTELNVQSPQNQFVANNTYNNTLPVLISGYDINYSGLEKIELQYKPSNQASWVPLGTEWFKDTVDINTRYPNHIDPRQIPRGQSYITYQLKMDQLIDQDYDLRAISTCKIPFNPDFAQESSVISGVFDRVNPHPFGSPSPADGVLDPNDDISIRFNEQIEAGSLTPNNFQITGVLNGQELRHDKAIAFNGTTEYLEIDNGFDFASGNFTIEFWLKRTGLGTKQTILSQGVNQSNRFEIGFAADDKVLVHIAGQEYKSDFTILDDSLWHHYAITYDKDNLNLEITDRLAGGSQVSISNNFFSSYQSGGKTFVGKNAVNNGDFFSGSIHQLRIWNRPLNTAVVASRINQNLNGREAGLIGFWPMDKGRGDIAEDKARFRHAEMKAEWEINPKSTSASLNGVSQYVVVDTAGTLAMTQEMDLSMEFWFKTAGGKLQTLLSNGSGRFAFGDNNRNGWNIEMNAQNEIWVKNDSFAFKAVETNFADDSWHHFALVVNRLANATAFIDGQQQKSTTATNFWGFSGNKLVIGARFSLNGVVENIDQHFDGEIDEVRIWNTALLRENIELNRYNRLKGDEFGLQAYYPFEDYRLELGVPKLDASNGNQSTVLRNPQRTVSRQVGGNLFSTESPAVALQRPVEQIKYSWSVNNDEIVITPNEDPSNIENVTLNVSVQGVRDLHGNVMQSPKTWIAFVNKNQVLWQDAEKNLSKEFNDTMSFTSRVINSGGDVKTFTISNIPAWLTVSPSTGTINPQSTQSIRFTVNPAINIGDYTEDLLLSTDFGFNEKLLVNLKVRKTPPAFNFDRNLYSKSMNVIGQIAINGAISTNDGDILVAYINNEVRGKANLQYMPTLDRYMAFLDVYSNSADSVTFKVWNSAEGELHEDVTPNLYFVENNLVGSVLNPQIFDAVYNLAKPIVLNAGWNWVSFPLTDGKMAGLHSFFQGMNFSSGDVVKTIGNNSFAQYGGSNLGWSGGLTRNGLNNEQSYLIHITAKDTLMYSGLAIDPDTLPINVVQGWNRIGFVSTKNVQTNSALANYNATDGDLIKSQQAFAVYVTNLGWVGSLTTLEPTEGYLLKSASNSTFVYPRRGLLRIREEPVQQKLKDVMPALYELNPNAFEASTNAIIKINTCEELLANEDWSLAAFKNNELRGFVKSTNFVDEELGHQYFITVYGEGNETYTFKMINQESGEQMEVNAKLDFEKNKLQGEVPNPLQFNLFTEVDCNQFKVKEQIVSEDEQLSYPNPFSRFVTIVVPNSITETGQVQIIDKNGRTVFNRDIKDQRKFHLNGAELYFLANGVYTLKFTDGETVVTEKLVRIK